VTRPDSAQFSAALGTLGALTLSDLSTLSAIFCALTGASYTLWRWHREAKRPPTKQR
jgi:hypothetical protein